jgi:hypothetical protein
LALSLLTLLLALLCLPAPVFAQEAPWSPALPIPGYLDDTLPPYLVTDQNQTVHAFSWQGQDEEDFNRPVIYSQWRLDKGWSQPIDIVMSPKPAQARVLGATLDRQGNLHVIFFGGDDYDASIYHSYAPALQAGNAHAWSQPLSIGDKAVTPQVGGLATDDHGNMLVVYAGNLDVSRGLYAVQSHDGGVTWSEPEMVYSTYVARETPFDFELSLGASGVAHMVWNVVNFRGQNIAAYYAQLSSIEPGQGQWSEPILIDQNAGLGVAVPAVIEHQDVLYLFYNNGLANVNQDEDAKFVVTHWFRRSTDGGATWSEPITPFLKHIGRNGIFSFVVDGNDDLHVFFGQRIPKAVDKQDLHGMWHAVWKRDRWIGPDPVASGVFVDTYEQAFDPYDARAVVSQGNVALVTWRTDPGRKKPGIWFAYKVLNAPQAPLAPLPTVPPTPTFAPLIETLTPETPTPTPFAPSSALPSAYMASATPAHTQAAAAGVAGPGRALLIGILPVGLLIAATAFVQSHRKRR